MYNWFKLFHDLPEDPKIKRLSTDEKWLWITLLCSASKSDVRGQVALVPNEVGLSHDDLGKLCDFDPMDENDPKDIVKYGLLKLVEMKMILLDENGVITVLNFDRRQTNELTNAERSRLYRESKKKRPTCEDHANKPTNARRSRCSVRSSTVTLDKTRLDKTRQEEEPMSTKVDQGGVVEVFEFWKIEHNHPKTILDKKRHSAISARLKEGYSIERIKSAICGVKNSPHHMGQNDRKTVYDDIELICRSGTNVDKFADLHEMISIPASDNSVVSFAEMYGPRYKTPSGVAK